MTWPWSWLHDAGNSLYHILIGSWLWLLFRYGPTSLGFWKGLSEPDVCAQLARNSQAADWELPSGQPTSACINMIQRQYYAFATTVHVALYITAVCVAVSWIQQWIRARYRTAAINAAITHFASLKEGGARELIPSSLLLQLPQPEQQPAPPRVPVDVHEPPKSHSKSFASSMLPSEEEENPRQQQLCGSCRQPLWCTTTVPPPSSTESDSVGARSPAAVKVRLHQHPAAAQGYTMPHCFCHGAEHASAAHLRAVPR